MRVIFEGLRRRIMGFSLDKRTQNDVVFGVGNAACCDALGLAARFCTNNHFGMLAHPFPPCCLHFLFFSLPYRGIGFRPIRHHCDWDEIQDKKLLFGCVGHVFSFRLAGWFKISPKDEVTYFQKSPGTLSCNEPVSNSRFMAMAFPMTISSSRVSCSSVLAHFLNLSGCSALFLLRPTMT